jgi:hypothetical protein
MAKMYKRLASISEITKLRSKGITAQAAKAGAMAKIGAKKNKTLFDIQDSVSKFKYTDTLYIQNCASQGIFCSNKKLIISHNKLDECIRLFINDIKNQYRNSYILNFKYYDSLNSIQQYNSFLNENIIIY